ncbi:right-handed parallel beta-helix repeat-containing protein [Planococcus sp. APC 4015]|nr:right-handed parallel beta-helix repeat-containing protein [Planococcus sp. APC 4015]
MTASALIALPASAASAVVVDDRFERSVAGGWGSATTGGEYRGTFAPGTMATGSGMGTLALAANQSASVLIGDATADDVRTDTTFRLDSLAGGVFYAQLLRYQPDGSHYKARLQFNDKGLPFLGVSRVNGRAEISVASIKLPTAVNLGAWYTLSFTITGDSPVSIQASLTKVGAAAVTPQLNTTDAGDGRITSTGRIGWWGYANPGVAGKTTLQIDRMTVTNGAAALVTAPSAAPSPSATATPSATPTATPSATPTATPSATPTATPSATPTPTPTPTTAPPAPDALAPGPSQPRGSAAVGTASYPIPSGAVYVDNKSVQSTQNGAIGTPFTTVQKAVDSVKTGATIVIRGGTYNEAVSIPYNKAITVQAYPKESVWFDGSVPVSSWSASGSTWVSSNWTAQFPNDMGGQASRFVQPSAPMANHPDQVFVNDVSQRQVATAAQVVPGTFAVDYTNKRLILGTDPAGKSVRASNLSQAFNVMSSGVTLQGFGVRRYATTHGASAAVRMQNTFATVRDLVVTDNAFIGISINNNDSVAERVTSLRNGMLGIGGNAAYRSVIRDSIASYNNVEKFKDAPVAGGIKVTRSRDFTLSNTEASNNTGSGIWFDESSYDMKILHNSANDNTTTGIQLEISAKATIAGNEALGGGTAVIIMNTSDVVITNNNFGGGTFNGVSLKQDERRQAATGAVGRDPRMGGVDTTVPWIVQNIWIVNNVFGVTGENAIRMIDGKTNRAVDTWNVSIIRNVFSSRTPGKMVLWGKGDNRSFEIYDTPGALAAAKGSSWINVKVAGVETVAQLSDDRIQHAQMAIPASADLARLLGWTTGVKRLGAAK